MDAREWLCTVATNRRAALQVARREGPDIIILDHTSARLGGAKFSRALSRVLDAPLIAIVRAEHGDNSMRATELLVKPYTGRQLLDCVRRSLLHHPRELVVGPLRLNLRTRRVTAPTRAEPQPLTPKQFALLRLLMQSPGVTLSRETLMLQVWQTDYMDDTRTLDVHIRWLRERIEADPGDPRYLRTVRGSGYCLDCAGD